MMMNPSLLKASRWLARHSQQAWMPIPPGAPILSITFDDVISTACDTGASLLEAYQARGTYYIAGALTDQQEEGKATHSLAQLQRLHQHGHQLACHGWSHRNSVQLPAATLTAELAQNAAFLRRITGDQGPIDFSYPFGAYSYGAKRLCAAQRRSCRVTGGGLHTERVDLHQLGCHRLYGPDGAPPRWQAFIDRLSEQRAGWGIIATHAVDPDCGPYGVTPDNFEHMLRYAQAKGCVLLTVAQAITTIQSRLPGATASA